MAVGMGMGAIDDLRAARCPSWNCTAACHRIWAWSTSHFDSRVRDPRSGDDPMLWRCACVVGAKRLLPRSLFPWLVGEESRGIGEAMREKSEKPTIQRRSFQYHWAVGLAHPMLRGGCDFPVDSAVSRAFSLHWGGALDRVTRPSLPGAKIQSEFTVMPFRLALGTLSRVLNSANALIRARRVADRKSMIPSYRRLTLFSFNYFHWLPRQTRTNRVQLVPRMARLQQRGTAAGRLDHISRGKGTTFPAYIISPSPSRQQNAVLDTCMTTVCVTPKLWRLAEDISTSRAGQVFGGVVRYFRMTVPAR